MAAVKHSLQSMDRWKDQAVVENFLKDSLLVIQSLSFFLCGLLDRECRDHSASYIVNRPRVYTVVNRVFLIQATFHGDSIEILAIQLFRL